VPEGEKRKKHRLLVSISTGSMEKEGKGQRNEIADPQVWYDQDGAVMWRRGFNRLEKGGGGGGEGRERPVL